jgi:hypothetical protein
MSSLIAALRASLSLDTVQFEAGSKRARNSASTTARSINKSLGSIKSFGQGFIGAFTVGALSAGVKAALNYAGSLGEVSQQLGVTTRDLQVLRFAAGQVGVSQEQLETGLSKLTITLGKVAAGAKAPIAALNAIGVSVDQLKGKDTGEAFRIIADALAKIPDRAQRAAIEVALFGKAGASLDNVLAGGSKAINKLAAAAEELGIVLSDEQIQKADDTADKLDAVKTVLAANIAGVVADNSTAILGLASSLGKLTSNIIQFLNSNPHVALGLLGGFAGARIGGAVGSLGGPVGTAAGTLLGGAAGAGIGAGQAGPSGPVVDKNFLKKRFIEEAAVLKKMRAAGQPFGDQQAKVKRLRDKFVSAGGFIPGLNPSSASATNSVGDFLAGGGGGGGKKDNSAAEAERARKAALRDAYQFAQDERNANIDILRAKQDLAVNTDERTALSLEILQLEHEGALAQIQFDEDMGDINDSQAKIRIAQEEKLTALQKDAILAEQIAQDREDEERMSETQFNIRRDELSALLNLAQTSDERRRIALQLLDLDYEQKRQALEQIAANDKLTDAVRARARAELDALPNQKALDQRGVVQSTAGPWEQAQMDFSDLSEEMEHLKVQGVMGVADAFTTLLTNTENWKDATISAIKQVIAEFIRLQTMKFLMNLASSAMGVPGGGSMMGGGMGGGMSAVGGMSSLFGGVDPMFLTGFATGGSFNVMGRSGVDRNMLSLNGLPIAKVSRGERVSVGTNQQPMGGNTYNMPLNFHGPVSRETMMQAGAKVRAAVASANRKGA